MKNKLLAALAVITLVGCNADMHTTMKVSDINNPNSNNKVVKGQMTIDLSGGCFETKTGAESDALSKADGTMYNLFGREQERISCTGSSYSSKAIYEYDIHLDTVEDGKSPTDNHHNIVLLANTEKGTMWLMLSDKFRARLKSRLANESGIKYRLFLKLDNDTSSRKEFVGIGVYMFNKGVETAYQTISMDFTGSAEIRYGSVAIDRLVDEGKAYLGAITEHNKEGK